MGTISSIKESTCCDPASTGTVYLPSGTSLILLMPRLLVTTIHSAVDVLKKTFDGTYDDSCPTCGETHAHGAMCCGIPEIHCPSPCVCSIHWVGCPGDSFKHAIQVTNTSSTEREFTLTSVPFPHTQEKVAVTPDKQTLGTDESLQAEASFTIPETFAGSKYRTVIKVQGAYEQSIQLCLTVRPRQACSCHVEQGDIPKRVKAHHWYHHFQCVDDCFESVKKVS